MFSSVYIVFRHNFDHTKQNHIKNFVTNAGFKILPSVNDDVSLIISIGGDGTFLRGVEVKGKKNIPVLGVNMGGHLGYLTAETDLEKAIDRVRKGKYLVEEKSLVVARVNKNSENIFELQALNEIVIRGENNKPINMDITISKSKLEGYFGDGIIISTPTGSTAYNLSLGGPIVDAECNNLVITPISPIDLNFRPIVLDDKKCIKLDFKVSAGKRKYIFADKQESPLKEGNYSILVEKAVNPLNIISFPEVKNDFIQILHKKILGHRKC